MANDDTAELVTVDFAPKTPASTVVQSLRRARSNMADKYCPHCGHDLLRVSKEDRFEVGGVTFVAPIAAVRCPSCGHLHITASGRKLTDLKAAKYLVDWGVKNKEAFRFMRKTLDLTAAQLASLLGVEPETISRWETGKRDIPRCSMGLTGALVVERSRGRSSMVPRLRALAAPRPHPAQTVKLSDR